MKSKTLTINTGDWTNADGAGNLLYCPVDVKIGNSMVRLHVHAMRTVETDGVQGPADPDEHGSIYERLQDLTDTCDFETTSITDYSGGYVIWGEPASA